MKANEIINHKPKARKGYQAFEISAASRSQLAGVFPPKFSEFIGHHITYAFGVMSSEPLPQADNFVVVGYVCDDAGLEALVVEVDGSSTRPDGKAFHITWSLDRSAGFKPVDSNNLITSAGWTKVAHPINITATAKFL